MNNKATSLSIVVIASLALVVCLIRSCYARDISVENDFIRLHHILTPDNCATPELKNLFNLAGVYPENDSLAAYNKAAQATFLRPAGKERWEVEKNQTYEDQRHELEKALNGIGLLEEIVPQHKEYDYAFFMGSTVGGMRDRLAYYFKLLRDRDVTVQNIVIWVGERPLDDKIESSDVLTTVKTEGLVPSKTWEKPLILPGNEADAMAMIIDQVEHPTALDAATWIRVPMKQMPDGRLVRPTTGDTAQAWLDTHPTPGSCLVISSQPHVGYQDAVVRTYLPAAFTVDTVGAGVKKIANIGVYLDALARLLYQETQRLEKQRAQ